ncbi:MAG: putative Ig domain-containing protein [Saprospiraceae bacterium]
MKNLLSLVIMLCFFQQGFAQFTIKDVFGRDLQNEKITLVDWEGYLANPAIELEISPPNNVAFPITLTLSANHARLYFDNQSSVGSNGPTKSLTFNNANPQPIFLSIFPDRVTGDENYTLSLQSSLGNQTYPIFVVDQDVANPTIDFAITLDYSQDGQYSFFTTTNRNVTKMAADDWAYFLADMNYDDVAANNENTYIWNDNFMGGQWVSNTNAYNGFYLYAYGLHADPHRSGGAPSNHAFQSINGNSTQLRRSGSYNADPHGNFNTLGWNTSITDDTWYLGTNFGDVSNDLYSIALHEMGHALSFNPEYPAFSTFKNQGFINDAAVVNYQGANVPVNSFDHLDDGSFIVDRISKRGAFGSEYAATMPNGRWLITKLNLLILQAIGYDLKSTSPFSTVDIANQNLVAVALNSSYSEQIMATGGIPFYNFSLSAGALPSGISLNAFTGALTGTPNQAGTYNFTVRVEDYDLKAVQKSFSLEVLSALPVQLVDFTAETTLTGQVKLQWETANEINSDYFVLQRSVDGVTFSDVTQIVAVGNSRSHRYAQLDETPVAGVNYYRLQQFDQDGNYQVSPVITIDLSKQKQDRISEIYPNPSSEGFVNLDYFANAATAVELLLYDVQGRQLFSRFTKVNQGNQTIKIDITALEKGYYHLAIITDATKENRSLIKL